MAALQILGAVIAGIAGFLWLVMLWAGQLNRPKRAPPGSFGLPVIGETLQFAIDGRSLTPHVYAEKRKAKYGPVYTTHHMGYPAVMSVDPEVNKFIMQNEGKYFVSNYPRSLRNLFGEGAIVRVYGELHKRIHNVVLSFINTSKLKEYVLADVEHMIQTPMTDWARRPVVYVEDECKTVINETLRLVNPASGVLRRAIKDVEFKEYFFPKDWLAFPYIRSVHLEESVYPDPFTFNPWRWEKKITSMYFTPFGGGLRVCAGQELAKLEICVFLHYLVTQFTWTLHDDEQINFPAVTFKNQLPMTVRALHH